MVDRREPTPDDEVGSERSDVSLELRLEMLPERLGYRETAEGARLADEYSAAYREGRPDAVRILSDWQDLARDAVDRVQGENYPIAQIGLQARQGQVFEKAGRINLAVASFVDAHSMAHHLQRNDIGDELYQKIALLLERNEMTSAILASACRGILETEIEALEGLEELGLDFDDTLGAIIGILYEAGYEDPEATLREAGILE